MLKPSQEKLPVHGDGHPPSMPAGGDSDDNPLGEEEEKEEEEEKGPLEY